MPDAPDQILTVAAMRAAEAELIAGGTGVGELMRRAGQGAGQWVWRFAARRRVTVLCGPGNNGGDGYVIAETLRQAGGAVQVIAAAAPATPAARSARAAYGGTVLNADASPHGEVLVDCLFGTGLTRPLAGEQTALLHRLAASHPQRIAVDLPSGIEADSGRILGRDPPRFDLTLALGAWKFAHFLMPAAALMGQLRPVPIGVATRAEAARIVRRPHIAAPAADAHKYRRGLLGVVAGAMPGAALLAARAAQGAGAGYVRLLDRGADAGFGAVPPDLVRDSRPLAVALGDHRHTAVLIGPGLGRDDAARAALAAGLAAPVPAVLDADALALLTPDRCAARAGPLIATPHEGELAALERAFGLAGDGTKTERARALADAAAMVVIAKGPDTVVAAPGGRMALTPRATAWLSTAGSGDVLAGAVASRLATGAEPFAAACEGLWLHAEAARGRRAPFTAGELAEAVADACAVCL